METHVRELDFIPLNTSDRGVGLNICQEKPQSLRKGVMVNFLNPHPYMFWLSIGAPLILRAFRIHVFYVVLFVSTFYILLV